MPIETLTGTKSAFSIMHLPFIGFAYLFVYFFFVHTVYVVHGSVNDCAIPPVKPNLAKCAQGSVSSCDPTPTVT